MLSSYCRTSWKVDDKTGIEKGNPLKGSSDIYSLRRVHREHLSKYDSITSWSHPIIALLPYGVTQSLQNGSVRMQRSFGLEAP